MKHLKQYEDINKQYPEIGDYVICLDEIDDLSDFINNNIGVLIQFDNNWNKTHYIVKYNNIPEELEKFFTYDSKGNLRPMLLDEILYWSKNKEELEIILNQNKFNL